MRFSLPLLLVLPLSATAAMPDRLDDPALDARFQALRARFEAADRDRAALTQQPVAAATWSCPVPEQELRALAGSPADLQDAVTRQNALRMGTPPLETTDSLLVPLEGTCVDGRLQGRVAFWLRLDHRVNDGGYAIQYSSRTYQRVAMTLADGRATDLQSEMLTLITRSNNKYLKASSKPGDGTLAVSWSHHGAPFSSRPGQAGLTLLRLGSDATTLALREEKVPGEVEGRVFSSAFPAPVVIRERYDSSGALVERRIGDSMRNYQAADGSWKTEMLKAPATVASAPPAAAPPAPPATTSATPAVAGGQGRSFNRIDGNSGRYLSPITRNGLPAAWVGRTSDGNGIASTVGGMAGSYVGEKALQQVPFVGGFLGRKAGEAAARKMAQQAAGGDAYMRETSDVSFNSVDDLAGWLVQNHSSAPGFDVVLKAATRVYPELNDAYLRALRAR